MPSPATNPGNDPTEGPQSAEPAPESSGEDRRTSGKRARARDRLMDRANQPYPKTRALTGVDRVENLLLFIDDDLRETAMAISNIEAYLIQTLAMLERQELTRLEVHELASDTDILEHVDLLNETLESLRRRMARLASNLR